MTIEVSDHIKEILDNLPQRPGVYLHKDADGRVIYVGKTVNLRNRVRSYFQKNVDSFKTRRLRDSISDIEIITTDSI
ncbi:MAG: GIY-YIG nuclease family protein [Candidatus Promineifilaceae bacterium]